MEIKNPEKIHRKHTPAIIDAENRRIEEEEPEWYEFWNSFSNLTVEYYMKWGVFPNYAYVNDKVWAHANNELTRGWAEGLSVQVLTHPLMPWDKVAMHFERHDPRDVALYYRNRSREELLEQGKAVIV